MLQGGSKLPHSKDISGAHLCTNLGIPTWEPGLFTFVPSGLVLMDRIAIAGSLMKAAGCCIQDQAVLISI
jgi:hypothetical protein